MIRVLSAIVLGLVVLGIVWFLPGWGVGLLVILASALGLMEFGRMFLPNAVERWAMFIVGLATAAMMVLFPDAPEKILLVLVFDLFILTFVWIRASEDVAGSAARLAIALMGVVYLGIAFPFWSWIEGLPGGKEIILLALVPACLCDTCALVFGKTIGRHKLAPVVSPNKTVEGLAGALVGSFVGVFLMRWILVPQLPIEHALVLTILIWVTSPFGDLVESFFKRSSGVKDSGTIIPGHGGVLDRLDALIFTGPAVYAYFKYAMGM